MDPNITLAVIVFSILGGSLAMIIRATREPIVAPARPADGKTLFHCFAAGLLSLVLVGAGQFYNHQFKKALGFLIAAFFAWFLMLGWIIHVIAFIDAAVIAYRQRDNPWARR